MSRKYILERTSSGRYKWVKLKRSHSHRHGHDHHHPSRHAHHVHHVHDHHSRDHDLHREYYAVSAEQWEAHMERERVLEEANRQLTSDNHTACADLAAAQAEVRRLTENVIPELRSSNDVLYADNQALRASLDKAAEQASKHHGEVERLERKIDSFERENRELSDANDQLRSSVCSLMRQLDRRGGCSCGRPVPEAALDARYWRNRWDDLDKIYHDLLERFKWRTKRMEAYEDILRMRGIIA